MFLIKIVYLFMKICLNLEPFIKIETLNILNIYFTEVI